MKHLSAFSKFNENISVFSQDIKKLIPNELNIINDNGQWLLKKKDIMIHSNLLQIVYYHNTFQKSGNALSDGEPDYLEFDIHMVKENKGYNSNPDSLRLNIDITYGDAMIFEFTIDPPNKVNVHHYTGINSKYDPKSKFYFSDDSIKKLVNFFNRFNNNYKLTDKNFTFLDSDPNSYQPDM